MAKFLKNEDNFLDKSEIRKNVNALQDFFSTD